MIARVVGARGGGIGASLACAIAAVAACGVPDPAPPLSNFTPPSSSASSVADGAVPNLNGTATVPTCNLGPDGGVCACADQTTVVDPPTLYFLLDRSASMADNNKWSTIITVIDQLVVDLGPRIKVGAAVFPYVLASDVDGCRPGQEVFPPVQGNAPAGASGIVATTLLQLLGRFGPLGSTPTAATIRVLTPYLQSLGPNTFVVLATDGGPNCNPDAVCSAAQCQVNIAGQCVTGGNCCAVPGGGADCNDSDATVAAVSALAWGPNGPGAGGSAPDGATGDGASGDGTTGNGAGDGAATATPIVPVYVVGVPGSAPYAQLLNDLATAGGTAKTGGTDGALYYKVDSNDQTAFLSALKAVAAKITATCTLTLDTPPADSTLINVFFDEKPLPQVGPDGQPAWTLDGSAVTLLGRACDSVQNGDVLDVRVVAGCPTVIR
jgi:hypothetical protein